MSTYLKRLKPQARALISSDVYSELTPLALNDYIVDFKSVDGRQIDIEPVVDIINTAVKKFHDSKSHESDAWLAPRVHAALKLYRAEAADQAVWEFLTVCVPEIRAYVVWRWGGENGIVKDLKRVYGSERRNAIGRLWWSAELTRNGPDYSPINDLFLSQDAVNYITDTRAFNNRPAAIAYTRIIRKTIENGGKPKDAKDIGKRLNHVLVTIMLDAAAPDDGIDMDAYERWISEPVDQTLMYYDEPVGPNEPKVPEEKIAAAAELMDLT